MPALIEADQSPLEQHNANRDMTIFFLRDHGSDRECKWYAPYQAFSEFENWIADSGGVEWLSFPSATVSMCTRSFVEGGLMYSHERGFNILAVILISNSSGALGLVRLLPRNSLNGW